MEMDLASLQSVKQFAKEFSSKFDKVDILVNNAGVVCDPRSKERTVDGFEPHMGVNHIGHFLLTNLLLEPLKKAAPSRFVITFIFYKYDCPRLVLSQKYFFNATRIKLFEF